MLDLVLSEQVHNPLDEYREESLVALDEFVLCLIKLDTDNHLFEVEVVVLNFVLDRP